MNLTELAKLANVSVSTASKALSGCFDVSDETRAMIIDLAKKHGCYTKYYKPKYGKKLIAVICPELLGIHYTQMATYIKDTVSSRGGTTLLSVSDFSLQEQNDLIEYYTKFARVDGVIIVDSAGRIKNDTDIPIVQIGLEKESLNADCVTVDTYCAAEEAVRYAVKTGNHDIAFIGEKLASPELEYFKYAMEKNNLPIDKTHIIVSDKRFYDAGYYSTDKLLKLKKRPDIIFAAYSHIAVGILKRLGELSLKVPDDISLVCMDNIISAPYFDIRLASIKMPLDELCEIALDLLYKKMQHGYSSLRQNITVTRSFEKGCTIKNKISK